jgi:hypothetical protein
MVAGLMVAMAVIALGRDATNVFQDEGRSAASEMSVRLAKERLRNDLEHVGLLSTGSIYRDPSIARTTGDLASPTAPAAPTNPAVTLHPGIANLHSVRLFTGYSVNNAGNDGTDQGAYTYSANNVVNPDGIELSGSMTTVDEFTGYVEQPPNGGACAARIHLNPQDPAVIRLTTDAVGVAYSAAQITANLLQVFHPVPTMTGGAFGLRVSDFSGTHFQYAQVGVLCGAPGAGVDAQGPYVEVQDALLTSGQSPFGVVPGNTAGSLALVNPVQVVRWHIRRKANAILDGTLNATNSARFELVRTWVPMDVGPFGDTNAFAGCTVAGANVCDELVSEFAVDLKFGFSVVTPPANAAITSFDMDTQAATNTAWAPPAGFVANNQGPHLIRGIRFRLAIRSSFPDRKVNIVGYPNYLYRYCTDQTALANCQSFSRVRTTVEDVFLMNQINMTTPPY